MGSFGVDDVVDRPPAWPVLVRRGLRRRCPRCGAGGVFASRFRLKERCGHCGYRFRREPGFFLGAWFLNFMLIELFHWVGAMGYIVWRSNHPTATLWPPVLVAVAIAVVIPVLTYPHSQTVWAAIDLAMTPLELDEIVDAVDAVDQSDAEADGHDARPDGQ